VDLKPDCEALARIARQTVAAPVRARRSAPTLPADPWAPRADATWQASSFDLAQGLDVKVMQSKLPLETLDRLFRG
jgi:hypothetical protein